jgi:outer membrane protein OmpA-like peptidoglycan-associated protein
MVSSLEAHHSIEEHFVRTFGQFGNSQLTAKAAVIALVAGLLGAGAVIVATADPAIATACGSGSTSETYSSTDPSEDGLSTSTSFRISTAADLIRLSAQTKDLARHFIQTEDIDLGGCEWTPIAPDYGDSFSGVFDGGGHTITGLSVNLPSGIAGMFGRINGASAIVKNLRLENVSIRGGGYVGSIAGWLVSGRVEASYATGSVTGTQRMGGLVGYSAGVVENSYSKSDVTIADWPARPDIAKEKIGGFTGSVGAGSVSKSYSIGLITDSATATAASVGGFTGERIGTVTNSFWDTESSGLATSVAGTGKTTALMKSVSTFSSGSDAWDIVDGWEAFDFSTPTNFWGICSAVNDGYPFLLWEYTTDPCTVAPPPSNSDSGSSSGSVYVAPVVVPEVIPSTVRQITIRQATDDKPARLLGRSLNKDVLFVADSAKLSPAAKKSLRQAARLAKASDGKVAVTGFAAMTNRGSAYEKSVALKRARVVARFLRAQGFDDWIYFHGLSGRQGQAFEGDPRRVEIRILK